MNYCSVPWSEVKQLKIKSLRACDAAVVVITCIGQTWCGNTHSHT